MHLLTTIPPQSDMLQMLRNGFHDMKFGKWLIDTMHPYQKVPVNVLNVH